MFASVHDLYWTHTCSINQMSAVIRDTFIALHLSDVLANVALDLIILCSSWNATKATRCCLAAVEVGSLLQKLADCDQTMTSFDILNSATKLDLQEPKVVGPLTSPEELLEALDLAISPDGEDLEHHGHGVPKPLSPW